MNKERKAVTILTGFLGAGKTSFLNHLLQKYSERRYAIIENEFGEQSIDSELLIRPEESIITLNDGCLCCTLNDNLYDILNELYHRRDEFDEIIIEATGVAHPAGLVQPFVTHPLIKKNFPLKAIICLVDAEQIEKQLQETEEALPQISFSDFLVINKTDLVTADRVDALVEQLHKLNPLATILQGNKEHFPDIAAKEAHLQLDKLLAARKFSPVRAEVNFASQKPKHSQDIQTQTFRFDRPFRRDILHQQLLVYLNFQAKDLYRIKGLLSLEGTAYQYLVQSAGKRLDMQEQRIWRADEPRQSVLVFIGKNLPVKALDRLLHRCLVK